MIGIERSAIENALKDENGDEVSLKPGAPVKVNIRAKLRAEITKR